MGCRADLAACSRGNANRTVWELKGVVGGGGQILRCQGVVTDNRRRFFQSADKPGMSHSRFLQNGHMTGRLLSGKSRPVWTLQRGL